MPKQIASKLFRHSPLQSKELEFQGAVPIHIAFILSKGPAGIGDNFHPAILLLTKDCTQSIKTSVYF